MNRYLILFCLLFLQSCYHPDLDLDQDGLPDIHSICIIGDSISTFDDYLVSDLPGYDGAAYACFYPQGDVESVEITWWHLVAHQLGIRDEYIVNCSWSGSTVTGNALSTSNAVAACSVRRIRDVSAKGFVPEVILCYISCNDWGASRPVGSWTKNDPLTPSEHVSTLREAYALMLYRLKEAYPESRIFCLTNLEDIRRDRTPGWPSNNTDGVSVEEWNRNIVEVAEIMGCDVIDLHGCGISYDSCATYTLEGLHPNAAGMRLMAKTVLEGLKRLY